MRHAYQTAKDLTPAQSEMLAVVQSCPDRACLFEPANWFSTLKADTDEACKICQTCPITDECLEYALSTAEHGVWGGTTERERRRLLVRQDRRKRVPSHA